MCNGTDRELRQIAKICFGEKYLFQALLSL